MTGPERLTLIVLLVVLGALAYFTAQAFVVVLFASLVGLVALGNLERTPKGLRVYFHKRPA